MDFLTKITRGLWRAVSSKLYESLLYNSLSLLQSIDSHEFFFKNQLTFNTYSSYFYNPWNSYITCEKALPLSNLDILEHMHKRTLNGLKSFPPSDSDFFCVCRSNFVHRLELYKSKENHSFQDLERSHRNAPFDLDLSLIHHQNPIGIPLEFDETIFVLQEQLQNKDQPIIFARL